MSKLIVKPVETRAEQKKFINYAWQHYRGNPNWVPPLLMDHKGLLGYRHHAFCEDASVQTFLALREGKVCGRVAAIINNEHNRRYHEKRGFFGWFECEDSAETANALFDAAKEWLFARGMNAIRGPANPS